MVVRPLGAVEPLPLTIVRIGQTPVRQGASCPAVWRIESGLLSLDLVDAEGRTFLVDLVGPGDALGVPEGAAAPWTATAWRTTGIAHQVAGRLDKAEHAFRQSLGTSAGFSLFTSWAAARLALVLLARQRIADADPYVAVALAEGPGLARYEADLAAVELAAMAEDGRRHDLARDALRRCRTGGHLAHAARLVDLAERSATS